MAAPDSNLGPQLHTRPVGEVLELLHQAECCLDRSGGDVHAAMHELRENRGGRSVSMGKARSAGAGT
jgi:hypothetical protein